MAAAGQDKMSHWQSLMDAARVRWGESLSYGQFLARLDGRHLQATLLGDMHAQINNGGVQQWVDNGYACHAADLLALLAIMGSPRAMEWRERLYGLVSRYVRTGVQSRGMGSNYWKNVDQEQDDHPCWRECESLDSLYYSEPFSREFTQEVVDFLAR